MEAETRDDAGKERDVFTALNLESASDSGTQSRYVRVQGRQNLDIKVALESMYTQPRNYFLRWDSLSDSDCLPCPFPNP